MNEARGVQLGLLKIHANYRINNGIRFCIIESGMDRSKHLQLKICYAVNDGLYYNYTRPAMCATRLSISNEY